VDPALFEDPKFEEEAEVDMPAEVDVSGLLKEVDSEAHVEVTDDDMNDPDLLAELNEIAEPGFDDKQHKIQTLREQVASTKKKALKLHKSGEVHARRLHALQAPAAW
jgi:hypothetical protein